MSAYGFEIASREEAQDMGLPDGSGLFSELFLNMLDEISKNKFKAKDYDQAPNMTSYEKKISFLNRYFVYKKVRVVNTETVELEIGEYQATVQSTNKIDTQKAQEVAKEEVKKSKPKVRKLSKKLLLVAATEAIDEPKVVEPEKKPKKSKKVKETIPVKSTKKLLIVESDSDEE